MSLLQEMAMASKKLKDRIEKLRDEIRRHDHLYYVEARPEISDEAYDRLFHELKSLEEAHPELLAPDSPTRKVGGAPRDDFSKVAHINPMLSLDSSSDPSRVLEFLRRIRERMGSEEVAFVLEPKLDGISVELVFEKGRFVRAVTRGDGRTGEDVTSNLKTVRSLPLLLRPTHAGTAPLFAVRGEVVMKKSAFHALNRRLTEEGRDVFANPRNATSGAVRQLDPAVTASRPLDVYCYEVLALEGAGMPEDHWTALEWIREAGLMVPLDRSRAATDEEIFAFHGDLERRREEIDYEMDGVVIKIDRLDLHGELGMTAHHPRWAYALKFKPRSGATRVSDIAVQVGRTGALTPVALLDPVDVGGVTVSRASLHNIDVIRKLDVRIGDAVKVRRAGDVIPEVHEVDVSARRGKAKAFEMPARCPVCGAEVVREGAYTVCPAGQSCPAQLKEAIRHWASRGAADIETLGKKKADQIVELGLVGGVADLYALGRETLAAIEGWGEKSADNLLSALEASKRMGADRFLFALGIRHVGERVARLLVGEFPSLEALAKAGREELEAIHEVGPEIAESVVAFFKAKGNRDLLKKLDALGLRPVWPKGAKKKTLQGKTFVFTGALETLDRKDAEKIVEKLGGRAASSVSKKTDFVVAGGKAGSKLDKARKLGVEVITEARFREMAGL